MAKRKPSKPRSPAAKRNVRRPRSAATGNRKAAPRAPKSTRSAAGSAGRPVAERKPGPARLLPSKDELTSLYQRYTQGSPFDDHDKAFYFVLDVGGINRARQLLSHVEEVLSELEELQA